MRTFLAALLTTLFCALSANASDCGSLASAKLPDTTIESAAVVPAGNFPPPYGSPVEGLPEFCRVAGIIHPTSDSEIRFEVWLPVSGWNQKYLGVGNGGFAGDIDFNQLGGNIKRGFATAATDTGHQAGGEDASWAYQHPEKIKDFGWRGLHLTTANAKQLLEMFYRAPAKHTYFDACSDGGREALMEAQRFPDDFEGILAGAPANYWTALVSTGAANYQVLRNPAAYISSMKLPAIHTAVMNACDATDGLKDGIISDPARCHFDPAVLLCKGADSLTCLTAPQVDFLRTIYAGSKVFPGHEPGAELGGGGWEAWILGEGPGSGAGSGFFDNYFRYMVYGDPTWNPFDATVDAAFHAANEKTAQALNSTDPNLHAFQARGGKLILYHGWDDPAIAPKNTINYYQSVEQKLGSAEVSKFVRLYLVPGMQHCIGGPGPSMLGQFGTSTKNDGAFGALQRWVENGTAPAEIIATKYHTVAGKSVVEMTRPLCPYPQVAKYKGSGDPNDYHSFSCAAE